LSQKRQLEAAGNPVVNEPVPGGTSYGTDPTNEIDIEYCIVGSPGIVGISVPECGIFETFRPIQEIAPTISWAPSLPEPLVRFIGISELLGVVGLILPALLKIRPQLTALAAAALALAMLLANIFHIVRGEFFVLPMTGLFLVVPAIVAYGR
jgi:putative oxidoreductase